MAFHEAVGDTIRAFRDSGVSKSVGLLQAVPPEVRKPALPAEDGLAIDRISALWMLIAMALEGLPGEITPENYIQRLVGTKRPGIGLWRLR